MIFTTTKTRVHAENETRILSLTTDDSSEQTARVLRELATENNSSAGDLELWRDFQRWLAGAEHRVTIPYGPDLAALIKPEAVRLRRDFGSALALIRAHAILHQATRDRDDAGRIIADLDDYAVVRELVSDVIAEGVGATVSPTIRETVLIVGALAGDKGVMARDVAAKLGIDKSNASRRLRVAGEGGYILNLEDKRGRPHRWVIDGPLPDRTDVLPEPAQLQPCTVTQPLDLRSCAVAPVSEGKDREVVTFAGYSERDTAPVTDVTQVYCACGNELTVDESKRRGSCNRCFLKARR